MAAFVRRFRVLPSEEVLTEIEAVNIIDATPPAPVLGVGSGTLLIVGEYEDGPFAAGGDAELYDSDQNGKGPQEIIGERDQARRFGGLGFLYGSVPSNNPCARRHLTEFWNGNGFLKGKFLEPNRLILARVDTSVGSVAMSSLACIQGAAGPFNLEPGDTFEVTTETGGPAATTAIAAVAATSAGAAGTFPTTFAGGEQIGITIDNNPEVVVSFSAADQTAAQVIARINTALGFTAAVDNAGEIDIVGIIRGTGGQVILRDVVAGTLAVIGHSAGTTAGTGNVANVDATTAAEIAVIATASAAWVTNNASAAVAADGSLRVCSDTASSGTILVVASSMASELGFETIGAAVAAGTHPAGVIAAGTRVRDASLSEWVTMQTLTIPEGTTELPVGGPYVVKVRPALDDGSGVAAAAGTVTTLVDVPAFGAVTVTNPNALTVALDEPQMDVAYENAFDSTLSISGATREINHSISARRSDAVDAKLRSNAEYASANGLFGRKATIGAPVGFSLLQAINAVRSFRSATDRPFYTWPGWQVRIPEIAVRGTAGGLGFTASGTITVRSDGPLASINCQLAPEDDPGQETGLIEEFFEIEDTVDVLDISSYTALRREGICAPRRDRTAGSIYQSGVTTSTDAALKRQARRKVADFIQDSLAQLLIPFSKKTNRQDRRDGARTVVETFLGNLLSEDAPPNQRIEAFSVSESGNTADSIAKGLFFLEVRVRTLSSLDFIVINTGIGENVVTLTEAA